MLTAPLINQPADLDANSPPGIRYCRISLRSGHMRPCIQGEKKSFLILQTVFTALAVEADTPCALPEEVVGRAGGAGGDYNMTAICRDTSAEALGRLLLDVFGRDVRAFR